MLHFKIKKLSTNFSKKIWRCFTHIQASLIWPISSVLPLMLPLNLIRFVRKKLKLIFDPMQPLCEHQESSFFFVLSLFWFLTVMTQFTPAHGWALICYLHSSVLSNLLSARREVTVVEGWTKMNKSVQLFFTKS